MRVDRGKEGPMLGVFHAELTAHFLNHLRKGRIVDVADLVEQMMLDLEIQASQEPAEDRIAAGEIYRGLHLVDRPFVLDSERRRARDGGRQRELCLAHAMRE